MDLRYTEQEEAFRMELRAWLADALPQVGPKPQRDDWTARRAYDANWQRMLFDAGYAGINWPAEYGGRGATPTEHLVFLEETERARAPYVGMNFVGLLHAGPTLVVEASDTQKQNHLPGILRGDQIWCQGFSEPNAGSDLASLRTKAVRDGDDYVLSGQKIWTSFAHVADYCEILVRTDPDAPKHKGITMFMVNMKSPGITTRNLINLADRKGFNEVFFEDVRVPASQVVGEVNRGWYHMAVALDFERSGIQAYAGGRRTVERLVKLAKDNPELLRQRPSIRNELADRIIDINVGTFMAYRVAHMQAKGMVPNHEASASKLFGSEMGQRLAMTGMHLLGMKGELRDGTKHQVYDQATDYLQAVSATVAAGTSEIQRGIIATRGLGLPRG